MPRVPRVRLDHIRLLSDDTGLIQHAEHGVARRETGYTTDDNARALVVAAREVGRRNDEPARELAHIYLAFLAHAQREDGSFHNFLSYDRRWLDEVGSEDCQGRAAWACAEVLRSRLPEDQRRVAGALLDRLRPRLGELSFPRGVALALVALERLPEELRTGWQDLASTLGARLARCYAASSHHDWRWFEPVLTYANARLPEGMLAAHLLTGESRYLQIALETLDFLVAVTFQDGVFVPIGNRRWYARGRRRSEYDQQPIEAGCMVAAASAAWRLTRKRHYRIAARRALEWFHGRNSKGLPLADPKHGSCHDGLCENGLNLNQGAESTVMYLLALQDYART